MKITNSTPWPVWFLRRMTSWTIKQLEMRSDQCALAVFRNSRATWGGAARGWRKQITVCITKNEAAFPTKTYPHLGGTLQETIADRVEALVKVTAHELTHIRHWNCNTRRSGNHGGSEAHTDSVAFMVLRAFRQSRDTLLSEWYAGPAVREAGPKVSTVERRAIKAKTDLERWQRRLKIATGKVRKLKQRVRYYEAKNCAISP